MMKKARISGLVSYLNDKGQRLSIPTGECWVEEIDGVEVAVAAIVYWEDASGQQKTSLSLMEYAQYLANQDLRILEE